MKEQNAASRTGSRKGRATRAAANDAVAPATDTQQAAPADLPVPDPEWRRQTMAVAAYYRAERRDFAPQGKLDDWLAAEAEIDTSLGMRYE